LTELWERLRSRDTTLWPEGNVAANRLGWLDVADRMAAEAGDLASWAAGIDASRVVLLGMGGSSLGPEVLRAAVGSERLVVLDTTDPATIAAAPIGRDTFFLVSSKSGSTLEVNALLAHCWERVPDGARYAAITDPGTTLAALAEERGFARAFLNPPDIGGRYSVLSYFGLVPAALLGYDIAALCERARGVDGEGAVALGVELADAHAAGRDKVTIIPTARFAAFGLWVEQLIAESTGKRGTGLIPVPTTETEKGPDRHIVEVAIDGPLDLAAEFFRWEVATAIAGHRLGVDPFDEPNVTESKENTARVLESLPLADVPATPAASLGASLSAAATAGDYVSLQAYLPYGQDATLEQLRREVRDALDGMAVTAGYGPRFLHSTGQLHKGGPPSVIAVQLVPPRPSAEVDVPGFGYDFATLIKAQSIGDYQSLVAHQRRVIRVEVGALEEVHVS
jgi:hypothetical protein